MRAQYVALISHKGIHAWKFMLTTPALYVYLKWFSNWRTFCMASVMKSYNHFLLALISIAFLSLNSCSVITGIFKAGMGFGIFLVIAVAGLALYLLSRKSKG